VAVVLVQWGNDGLVVTNVGADFAAHAMPWLPRA
jgi:hypothetical protein